MMKTLTMLALIPLGVAAILYARVDLGMSWDDMAVWAEDLISTRLQPLLLLTAIPVVAILWVRFRRGH